MILLSRFELAIRCSLIACAVLSADAGIAFASQQRLSDKQLETVTAGSADGSLFSVDLSTLSGMLLSITTSNSTSSMSNQADGVLGLGEAGLTGSARLDEYNGVVRFLGNR